MDRILIFGDGQVGNFYKRFFDSKNIESEISKADITKVNEIEDSIKNFNPTVVINTAAQTSLEWCTLNKLEAFNANVLGADNVAQVCDTNNIYFIHFSSGCIFESKDATDVKFEDTAPNPAAFYSWTKVWSEELIKFKKSDNFKYAILRPRQPVSTQFHYKNMLVKFLTFTRFVDTPNTGTVIEDLMDWTLAIIEKRFVGTIHVANEGWATPYEIGLMLKKYVLPNLEVGKMTKEELDKLTPNKRVDTVLNVDKLKSLGVEVKPYRERLEEVIKELAENIKKMDKEEIRKQLDLTLEQSRQRTVVNDVWEDLLK